jgi:hypothetical protein
MTFIIGLIIGLIGGGVGMFLIYKNNSKRFKDSLAKIAQLEARIAELANKYMN